MNRALLNHAENYAARGWPVFLLGRSKRPVRNCPACHDPKPGHDRQRCECLTCHGFYAATTDLGRFAKMVRKVPVGLLAIRTGAPSRLVVIDIDPRNGGSIDYDLLAATYTVLTGDGGWHFYYTHPGDPIKSAKLGDRAGVDVKADGGYVVAPPSIHPNTKRPYQIVGSRQVEDMRPALRAAIEVAAKTPPAALVGTVISGGAAAPYPPARAGRTSQELKDGDLVRHPDRYLAACLHTIASAPKGTRRTTLYNTARTVAKRLVAPGLASYEHVWSVLFDAGMRVGQSERDTRVAVSDAFQAEGLG